MYLNITKKSRLEWLAHPIPQSIKKSGQTLDITKKSKRGMMSKKGKVGYISNVYTQINKFISKESFHSLVKGGAVN